MNRKNIQATIDILKQAQNFNIATFQGNGRNGMACTIEELHKCGNTACIGGYVALSQAWRDFGGYIIEGAPSLSDDGDGPDAIAAMVAFWELPIDVVGAIIFGDEWNVFIDNYGIVGLPRDDESETSSGWYTLTKDHAVSLFEQLLAKG